MPHGFALASWALVLGLVQGFTHCAAMCGPLVAAFQAQLAARDAAARSPRSRTLPPADLGPFRRAWSVRTAHLALAGVDGIHLAAPVPPLPAAAADVPRSPAASPPKPVDSGAAQGTAGWMRLTLLHQAGRVFAFAALGALAGAVGRLADLAAAARGLDSAAAVVGGVGMWLWALDQARTGRGGRVLERFSPLRAPGLARSYRTLVQRPTGVGAFLAGAVLGLHPCGLIFAVLLGAAATASAPQGALALAAFGLGTVPALFGVAGLSRLTLRKRRSPVWRYATAAWVATSGTLFLLRALALDRLVPHIQTWLF